MATSSAIVVFFTLSVCVSGQVSNGDLSFSMTPSKVALCGTSVASVIHVNCQLNVHADEIFTVEFGALRGTGGRHDPIARIKDNNSFHLSVVDNVVGLRITQTNWASGRLSLTLDNPVKSDLIDYYCSATFIDGSLKYSEQAFKLSASDYAGKVPVCDEVAVRGATTHHVSVTHHNAGKCSDGLEDRPEALVMAYCNSPTINNWQEGPKVMDTCCMIPPFTPVATFNFGMFVLNEHSFSGVFMGCIPNGFTMAFQMCGHPPMIRNLTTNPGVSYVEDPNNYHVMVHTGSPLKVPGFGK